MTDLTSPDGLLPSLGGWFHPLTALLVALDAPIPPVPSEVFVIGSGSLAAAGRVSLPLSVLTAWLGCWLGDVGLYALFRFRLITVLERWAWGRTVHRGVRRVLATAGPASSLAGLFMLRFVSGGRTASMAAAGVVGIHAPDFSLAFVLLIVPGIIALIAENAGHVKAIGEITRTETDGLMGRALAADGAGTVLATSFGGSATTTYAENIGVMAATRVYSTAAYVVAAVVAILFGFSPKFGAVISATPGGVLGGITVVLYGMIGLLGAKIWKENEVDFGNPVNLVPVAAGIIIGVGDVSLKFSKSFTLGGIALGTIVTVGVYHLARWLAPHELSDAAGGTNIILDAPGMYVDDDTPQ